jgi:hypothetical protein
MPPSHLAITDLARESRQHESAKRRSVKRRNLESAPREGRNNGEANRLRISPIGGTQPDMETIRLTADVHPDGSVHIDAVCTLSPGPVEVVLVLNPASNGQRDAEKEREKRVAAARALRALSLPVDTVHVMNQQATPDPTRLLP